jgi:hypothetical protein
MSWPLFDSSCAGFVARGYTEEHLKIQGDRLDAQLKQFLEASFRSCQSVVKPGFASVTPIPQQ